MQLRFKDIMTRISEYIKSEMYDYFTSLPSDAEQRAFVKKVMHDDPDECTELLDKVTYVDEFETVLDNRKDIWVDSMKIYLDSCVKTVYLSQIRVSASQRGRAIDIYENLNMGGVSLNTFDLIMARVAKVDKKNFLQRIKESIESTKTYPNSVLESSIKTILSSALTNKTYNATHLDFLIYNRIGKKPVLAIEVDGYEYHKEDTVQASRDLLKNHIMELYEVPLLRFMTNGSGEKEKIIEMLDKLVG